MALFFSLAAFAEKHYICYNCTTNKKLQICICFENNNAIWIKYKGQHDSIPLFFVKEITPNPGYAAYEQIYTEKYKGKVNGTYLLSHSGIYDDVVYTRKKDGKKFNFTINFDLTDGGGYLKTPCF
ncbi:MAG: hypothetical protein RJA07_23 [Bacteroidota bacterium]